MFCKTIHIHPKKNIYIFIYNAQLGMCGVASLNVFVYKSSLRSQVCLRATVSRHLVNVYIGSMSIQAAKQITINLPPPYVCEQWPPAWQASNTLHHQSTAVTVRQSLTVTIASVWVSSCPVGAFYSLKAADVGQEVVRTARRLEGRLPQAELSTVAAVAAYWGLVWINFFHIARVPIKAW